ncbi:MAG: hypothetical protein V1917_00010 [Candidatus Gottesmanbacteria bacterium]
MVKKAIKVLVWFQITIILLLVNLTVLSSMRPPQIAAYNEYQTTEVALSPSSTGKVLAASIEGADARELLLKSFIQKFQPNSPMMPYTASFIETADTYQIDFRLIPAIAMCESNLGSRIPSKDSFNAWGIAVYTGQQNGKVFNDWPHAIDWVGKYIREKYYNRSITDLVEIGAIWAPPSVEKENSWARCVEGFMDKIR